MGRRVATFWHATFSIAAGVLYFFFVLPRWWELMGDTSHTLGTAARIVAGVLIALAALPVVFTLLRVRKPEYGTPQLALTLQTSSIVAHVLAGVLIVGTAISEIWLNLDNVGQWLFAIYGAAAAIALLGIFGFYLSFVAELPPPPPKPIKPKKDKRSADRPPQEGRRGRRNRGRGVRRRGRGSRWSRRRRNDRNDRNARGNRPARRSHRRNRSRSRDDGRGTGVDGARGARSRRRRRWTTALEDATADSSARGLRNRRPTGKPSGAHRRRRSRRGVAVED